MKNILDTKGAQFDAAQITILQAAFDQAIKQWPDNKTLTQHMKLKLAKMIVNSAREHIRQAESLNVDKMSEKAVRFVRLLSDLLLV